jgi:hypothetical protein
LTRNDAEGTVHRQTGPVPAFIWAYSQINRRAGGDRLPARLQDHRPISPPDAQNLYQPGFIEKQPGVTRSIQLLVPPQELPILGLDQPVIINATGHQLILIDAELSRIPLIEMNL